MADTDRETFEKIMSGEKPEAQAEPEIVVAEQPEAESEDRPRDEHGRFAAKAKEPEAEPEVEVRAEEPEAPTQHRIPLAEHLSVRERAQNAERERDEARREREATERRLRDFEREIAELKKPKTDQPTPDIWTDPAAFIESRIAPVQRGQEETVHKVSRLIATDKFGAEAIEQAMGFLEQQMLRNPSARFEHQRIMASDHPYGELVAYHKRQVALQEVGDDPTAYRDRTLEAALKDPEFRKRAMEAWRDDAEARPSTVTKLPPSLNRTPGSAGNTSELGSGDASERFAGMFARK